MTQGIRSRLRLRTRRSGVRLSPGAPFLCFLNLSNFSIAIRFRRIRPRNSQIWRIACRETRARDRAAVQEHRFDLIVGIEAVQWVTAKKE